MDEQVGLSRSRTPRQITDKKGRFAALAKLKELKGSKNKYEISEVENVYEEVDEKEYSKRVRERQDEDWIIDDDGAGYVEDGREIFDDDLDDESIIQASKKKKRGGNHGKSKRVCLTSDSEKTSKSIHHMLMNMPTKKKEKSVNLEEDDILDDIMGEINGNPKVEKCLEDQELHSLSSEETAQKYLKNLIQTKPVPNKKKPSVTSLDQEKRNAPLLCRNINSDSEPNNPDVSKSVSKSLFQKASSERDAMLSELGTENFCDMDEKDFVNVVKEELFCDTKSKESISYEKDISSGDPATSTIKQEVIKSLEKVPTPSEVSAPVKDEIFIPEDIGNMFLESMSLESNVTSEVLGNEAFDTKNIPTITNASNQKVFRFFYLDALEDSFRRAGVIFLFGKVWIEAARAYMSCCVAVQNVERRVYILPREKMLSDDGGSKDVSILDVYNEFSTLAHQRGIKEFRFQKIQKNYCFNPDIPVTSEYMEVKYSAEYPILPSDLEGKTFSKVLGISCSPLERFLIERGIKGPCWLDVLNGSSQMKRTWCKLEVSVEKMEFVSVTQSSEKLLPPPVSLLCLQVKTVVNPKTNNNEVAVVVGLVNQNFPLDHQPSQNLFSSYFCILAPLSDKSYPADLHENIRKERLNVERVDSENALLKNLLRKISRIDPDLVVGHDILGFDLEVLLHRILMYRLPNWSQIGRLQRPIMKDSDKRKLFFSKNFLTGRLICDIMLSAKELVQNVRSYDLETLCSTVLEKESHPPLTFEAVRNHYDTGARLMVLVKKSLSEASNALQLLCHMSAIPLALQISNIAGNVMSRTLIGGRAERNEFLLLHAFHEKNYIPPDKQNKKNQDKNMLKDDSGQTHGKGRKKPAYLGGLVLEPKKGLYEKMVLVMDFNSLYPSIIMEFNICFTTVPLTLLDDNSVPELPSKELDTGILPAEIHKLVESRTAVKNMLQSTNITPVEKSQYHTRQLALKLMANSMYGCLGFTNARFYAKPLAALITSKGRELLMSTKELVENLNYEVIYGDTDSIMISTNSADFEDVTKIGKQIVQSVNKAYRCVKLDIDGIFKCMLLLKKKKYAVKEMVRLADGTIKTQIKHKGLDIVRRDWSRISIESGHYVVEQILSDAPLEERLFLIEQHLEKLRKDLEGGNVPLPLLTITKQLTRSVEQYQDSKSQPHVVVAKRLMKKGMCRMKAGDMVSYVICEDGSESSPIQRAYHLDELKENKDLKIDYKYYLAQQIHPVITRLLDPVDGIDACRIAEILGLDPTPYQQSLHQRALNRPDDPDDSEDLLLHNPDQYEKCENFSFSCAQCKTVNVIEKPYKQNEDGLSYPALSKCSNPQCTVSPSQYLPNIQNKLTLMMHKYVQQYSTGILMCEDPGCPQKTRYVPQRFHRAYPLCGMCKSAVMYKQVTDKDLYVQLYFFQLLFDIQSSVEYKSGNKPTPQIESVYLVLRSHVANFLKHNSYSQINLEMLFRNCSALPCNIKAASLTGFTTKELQQKQL